MIIYSFYVACSVIAIFMTGMFVVSLIKKDNSIVDTAYGVGFILSIWSTLFIFKATALPQLLIATLITIWALRLSTRIYLRNHNKPEDFRYKAWRDSWTWFKTRSFFQIYVLQGAIIIAIASVGIFINALPLQQASFSYLLLILGTLAWIKGFFFEAVGDYQLDQFIKNQGKLKAEGKMPTTTIMKEGLWSMTRHPNYFGEVTMWWGLWIIALSVFSVTPWILLTVISPLTITFLLLKVSGIPMLEKKYVGNKEYEEYQKKTNAFVPWWRK